MDLSLAEAARLLGKSERQLRYMIQNGALTAHKRGSRWSIRRQDLPISEGQKQAAAQKEARTDALELATRAAAGKRLALREMRAYKIGVPLYHELQNAVGVDHPSVALLHEGLMLLACGYYEFSARPKGDFYRRAREQVSRSVMAVMLHHGDEHGDLLDRFETLLLPAIGGLIRHSERWGARR